VDWTDQWGMGDDRRGSGPLADGWAVQSRRERERGVYCEGEIGYFIALLSRVT
jgi:hypothetical protein